MQNKSQNLQIPPIEDIGFFDYLINFSSLLPFNIYLIIELFDIFYTILVGRQCENQNLMINNPHFFQNISSTNYIIMNKNNLCYSDQYQIKGVIIQNRFFQIKSKEINQINIDSIRVSQAKSNFF